MIISIGQNCLNKRKPFEYIVPLPQEGSEQKVNWYYVIRKCINEFAYVGYKFSTSIYVINELTENQKMFRVINSLCSTFLKRKIVLIISKVCWTNRRFLFAAPMHTNTTVCFSCSQKIVLFDCKPRSAKYWILGESFIPFKIIMRQKYEQMSFRP